MFLLHKNGETASFRFLTTSEGAHLQREDRQPMIAVQIARLIANVALFLDSPDEEAIYLDYSAQALKVLTADIQALESGFLRELVDVFAMIVPEYGEASQKLVRNIPYYCRFEETLAVDDPEKLAELETRPDPDDD